MLSKEAFEQWCWQLGLSDQAKAVITQIRTSPPARHVQSSAGNVSRTYPSIKMGCAIQFESHRDELPFAYVTHALGAVVARLPVVSVEPKRERIRQVVSDAVEQLADGNIAAFARSLGLPRGTVENWCQGKRIPEMDMLLRLCYRLDLSLCEVLYQEGETLQPSLRDPVPPALFPSRKRTAIDKERIFHLLEQEASMAENPPPSLKEVGLRLGYQPTILYKINQTACHAIAKRHTAYRRLLREKRLQGYREEIRQIALYLQAEQMSLTQKHISRYLAQPAILRDPKVRSLLREVCHEVKTSSGEKS